MTSADVLVQQLLVVARDLEHRYYPLVGPIRQAAQRLAELPPAATAAGCPICGAEVVQTGRGRPRVHCSDACRKRAAASTRRNSDEMVQ